MTLSTDEKFILNIDCFLSKCKKTHQMVIKNGNENSNIFNNKKPYLITEILSK